MTASAAGFACERCGATGPVVGQIPVLVAHPEPYLSATRMQLVTGRLAAMRQERAAQAGDDDAGRMARARRRVEAQNSNWGVVESLCAPALRAGSLEGSALDSFLVDRKTGWRLDRLARYFVADWVDGAPARDIVRHVADLRGAFPGGGHAAVLGSGAGGLLTGLAPLFDRVTGVDLSLPALLLSSNLLAGGRFDLHVEHANWRCVSVSGAAPPSANVDLVAADAAALPFASGSLSLVVTQYLLDIVADPERVAGEIGRALAPGGVWLNLGLPFRLPRDGKEAPRRDADDMDAFVSASGFRMSRVDTVDLRHLDLSRIDASAGGVAHRALLFAAQKIEEPPSDPLHAALRGWFAGMEGALTPLVLQHRRGAALFVSATRVIGPTDEMVTEIQVGAGRRRPIDPAAAAFIETIWRAIGAARPIGAILEAARGGFEARDVVSVIERLRDLGAIECAQS